MGRTGAPTPVGFAEVQHPVTLHRPTGTPHCRDMGEDFIAALLGPDEAETLLIIPASELTTRFHDEASAEKDVILAPCSASHEQAQDAP